MSSSSVGVEWPEDQGLRASFAYEARRVEPLPVMQIGGWRLKRYDIRAKAPSTAATWEERDWYAILSAALTAEPGVGSDAIGFAMLHFARDGVYLLLSSWFGGHMLKHQLFRVRKQRHWTVESMAETGVIACVWELAVIAFERDAWVRTAMLGAGQDAALADYLETTFRGWV